MTDIVYRLRCRSDHYIAQHAIDTMDAAADEIERLRAERDVWEKRAMAYGAQLARVMSEKMDADEQRTPAAFVEAKAERDAGWPDDF